MQLMLERVEKQVGLQTFLYPLDMALQPGALTVLLGATQAGKTTLMRIMAGLDIPSKGKVKVDGQDVTGKPVRERNVAMVYQQFINYPSMTVYENIASPLKIRRERNIRTRVIELAQKLHIEPFLNRLPAELSGGQQQRVALARALAKNAPLMLLDEPLVNLDYKLREQLREELGFLFATGNATVVYATTEPSEALLLGGYTAVIEAGRLLQYGPTAQVFHYPQSIEVARAFSDPPMNLFDAYLTETGIKLAGDVVLTLSENFLQNLKVIDPQLTIGIRASDLKLRPLPEDAALLGRVELAEISGSDTFVHVHTALGELVAQLTGVHFFELGSNLTLYLNPQQLYMFDQKGRLLRAPTRSGSSYGSS